MRMLFWAVVMMLVATGCSNDDALEADCTAAMLEAQNMVAYDGQDVSCTFFLEAYTYNKAQYFLLGNHCADFISYPINCAGDSICINGGNTCTSFYENAVNEGIVGIRE